MLLLGAEGGYKVVFRLLLKMGKVDANLKDNSS